MLRFIQDAAVDDVQPPALAEPVGSANGGGGDSRADCIQHAVGLAGVPAEGGGVAASGRVGRPRGLGWSQQQRDRYMRSKAERKLQGAMAAQDELLRILGLRQSSAKPSRQLQTSQICNADALRRGRGEHVENRQMISGVDADGRLTATAYGQKRRDSLRRLKLRAALSLALKSKSSLASFIRRNKSLLVVSAVLDDASVWVQRMSEGRHELIRPGRPQTSRRGRRGRNVHMPSLNSVTHCVGIGDRKRRTATRLVAPQQILPQSNWSTIHDRFARWSVAGWEAGQKLSSMVDHELQHALDDVTDGVILLTQDGLGTNRCLVAEEQLRLAAKRRRLEATHPGRDAVRAVYDATCAQHTGCLCTRPVFRRLNNLNTIWANVSRELEN